MIAALTLLAAAPVITAPMAPPLVCQAAEIAMRDQLATMNVRQVPSRPGPGPLGRDYLKASDRLAHAMREDRPDFERINALWHEVNRLKVEIGQRFLANRTECDLEQIKRMPLDQQRSRLRMMSPPTTEEREKPGVAPPPPPRLNSESGK